jgi:type I restriction enzyme, S subunit
MNELNIKSEKSKESQKSVVQTTYKQTEVGLIPIDWEVKELGAILTFGSGRDYKQLQNGEIPVYGTGGVMTYVNDFLYDGESVGIGRKGTIDKPVFLDGKFWTVDTLFYTHQFLNSNPKFIYYKFCLIKWKEYNEASGVPSLNKNTLQKIKISIPDSAEQTAIATALSDADALISSLEKLIAKKRNIKQGAMQKLLQPKEGWEAKKLGEVCEIFRGGSPRPIESYLTIRPDGINWIKIGDVKKNAKYIESTEEKIISEGLSRSRFVNAGDFLLSNSMSFGRPYIMKISGCIHDGWLVIQNYQYHFDREFLYYVLGSESILTQYKAMASGSSVLNLNKEIVKNVLINCPTFIEEQTRIATILSDMDNEILALEIKLEKYKKVKMGMMQNLLTGKIRLV